MVGSSSHDTKFDTHVVAKLAKSFGQPPPVESLGDFRYDQSGQLLPIEPEVENK